MFGGKGPSVFRDFIRENGTFLAAQNTTKMDLLEGGQP
jgi:hypothetical protein